MNGSFRQSMAWLHTWCGLVCGWLLCAIFLTGTLSVFREPITRWMEARPVLPQAACAHTGKVPLAPALRYLASNAPDARSWRIDLPTRCGEALVLGWPAAGGGRSAALDPATGALLPQPWGRVTEGGRHFMSFHYMLHGGSVGFWIVGFATMGMLAALVSGVVVHRRIFQDFFTFRVGKGQRSWLDAHNASAVFTLPFLFMIAYTGLAFFLTTYMPWPARLVYGSERTEARLQSDLSQEPAAPRRQRLGRPAPQHDVAILLARAEALTGQPMVRVFIEHPGDAHASVQVLGAREPALAAGQRPTIRNDVARVMFDGVSGDVLMVRQARPAAFAGRHTHDAIRSLHLARFGGWTVKWLYFASGLLGTAMMATGVVLFLVKRRRKSEQEFGAATPAFYRFAGAMNVAAIAGSALASIAYLYANRLLPAGMAARDTWEIRIFLLALGLSLAHAWLVDAKRAWSAQFGAAAALCLALPVLNPLTTGQSLASHAASGDGQLLGVELVAVATGCLLSWLAWRLREPTTVTARSR